MGMFDSFYVKDFKCVCGKNIEEWQTKSLFNAMYVWHQGDNLSGPIDEGLVYAKINGGRIPVHTYCDNCESWYEGFAIIEDEIFIKIEAELITNRWKKDG